MNTTAVETYCPECGDEFEMVSTTIWVKGKRFHEDCYGRTTAAAKDAEIARLCRRLADCIVWMDTREEAQPGMPRLCDMARDVLKASWRGVMSAPNRER